MKNNNRKKCEISDLRIYFYPKTLTLHNENKYQFKIYLQKGVQVIGTIGQVPPHVRLPTFKFEDSINPVEFRTANEKFSIYQISLYEVSKDGDQIFLQKTEVNLAKYINQYYKQLVLLQDQMYSELRQKEGRSIGQIWKVISNNFTRKNYNSAVKFMNLNIVLEFYAIIQNDYDDKVKQYQKLEAERIQNYQKKEIAFNRSQTVPILAENLEIKFKKRHSDHQSDLTQMQPFKYFFPQKMKIQRKTPPKKQSPKNNKAKVNINDLSQIPQVQTQNNNSEVYTFMVQNTQKNNEIPFLIEEKIQDYETFNEIKNKEGYKPIIQISNLKQLISVQKNSFLRIGSLNIQSQIDVKGTNPHKDSTQFISKHTLIAIVLFVIYGVILIYLLYPIRRV